MTFLKNIYRRLRYYYYKIIRIRATPREIAFGFALGIFIGMTPTMGIQMAIVIPLAYFLKVSEVSAVIGVWITNPWTVVPIYLFNHRLGALILSVDPLPLKDLMYILRNIFKDADIINEMSVHIGATFAGGVINGLFLGIVSYVIVKGAVIKYRKKKFLRRSARENQKTGK